MLVLRLSLLAALALVLSACGTIRSTIGVAPGEQFVLGGEQDGAFTASLANVGAVAVDVAERTAEGETRVIATLPPGETTEARFAPGSAALLINRTEREARVRGTIRGDTDLGMRYTPVGDGP